MVDIIEIRAKSFASPGPVDTDLRAVLSGLVVTDWREALISRGFGWMTDVGGGTSPIVGGGAGTTFDAQKPELIIDVPTNTTMSVLRASIVLEMPVDAADGAVAEAEIGFDRTNVSGATATNGTVETPINMRSDAVGGCPCSVVSAITTNITAPTVSQIFDRIQKEKEITTSATGEYYSQARVDYAPLTVPFLVGPATFYLWWAGASAQAGYATVDFLAFPSGLINDLV